MMIMMIIMIMHNYCDCNDYHDDCYDYDVGIPLDLGTDFATGRTV